MMPQDFDEERIKEGSYSGVCPECLAGKHGNCNGVAWNFISDEPMECNCAHPGWDKP